MLYVPTPLAGQGGQLGFGVDGHRVPGRLEHRQVAGRVGVGHAFGQVEAVLVRIAGHDERPGFTRWGRLVQFPGEHAIISAHVGTDDVVEKRAERLDHEVQGACYEQRPVAKCPVLADTADPGGERLGHEQVARQFP